MKFLNWAFVLALAAIAVLFALSNLKVVDVGFWPVPGRIELPVYTLVLGIFVVGFFCGWFMSWIRSVSARHRDRVLARRAEPLEREVAELRQKVAEAKAPPDPAALGPPRQSLPAAGR